MLDKSSHVSGIMNIILESTIPVWFHEHRLQSVFFSLLIECIVFGQIYQKDKKYIHSLSLNLISSFFFRQQCQAEQLIEQDSSFHALIIHTHTIP